MALPDAQQAMATDWYAGWHTGRPSGLTAAQARRVRSLRADGEPVSDPMRTLGVSRATAYRALQQADDAEPPLPTVGTAPA
jgi:DNA invertase Pin-like site-specific DNA recombinase